jgi:hypothetical protein
MERRRHKRISTSIPVKIQVELPDCQPPWIHQGVLKNISYEGVYFRSRETPPLEQGQIRDFSFTATEEQPLFPGTTFIAGTCRVVRLDSPPTDGHDGGVALEFISAKFFDFLIKNS